MKWTLHTFLQNFFPNIWVEFYDNREIFIQILQQNIFQDFLQERKGGGISASSEPSKTMLPETSTVGRVRWASWKERPLDRQKNKVHK
jgi:hypothetical protein